MGSMREARRVSRQESKDKRDFSHSFEMTREAGASDRDLEEQFGGDVEAAAEVPNVVLVELAPRRSVRGAKIALAAQDLGDDAGVGQQAMRSPERSEERFLSARADPFTGVKVEENIGPLRSE